MSTQREGRCCGQRAPLLAHLRAFSVRRRSVLLDAVTSAMESDSDDVPLALRVPKMAARPAAAPAGVKRKAPPPAEDAPKRAKAAAGSSKPRGDSGARRAKTPAESADDSSSDEGDDEGEDAKGRSASRAAKKLEKDRKAVAEMTRIKKGVRLSLRATQGSAVRCCGCAHVPHALSGQAGVEDAGAQRCDVPARVCAARRQAAVRLQARGSVARGGGGAVAAAWAALHAAERPSVPSACVSLGIWQVATFFAVMKDTDYATKKVFVQNFWTGFRKVLKGENKQLITEFSKCDFTNIYNWHVEEREKKKLLTNEARVRRAARSGSASDPPRRRRRRRRRSATRLS